MPRLKKNPKESLLGGRCSNTLLEWYSRGESPSPEGLARALDHEASAKGLTERREADAAPDGHEAWTFRGKLPCYLPMASTLRRERRRVCLAGAA